MRWLKRHIVLFLMGSMSWASAQVLTPMGQGIPESPLASAESNEGYSVLSTDINDHYLLLTWDGNEWSTGVSATGLFKHDNSGVKECRVHSMVGNLDNTYVLVSKRDKPTDNFTYHVLRYTGNQWSEITDQTLSLASEINELLIYNQTLVAVGKNNKNTPTNIFYFESNQWNAKGNYITLDISKDFITDAEVYGNKIFITGVFTKIGSSDKRYLAEWNGDQWDFVSFPPFTQQTYRFGIYNSQLVLHGKPASGNEAIRVYNGSNWQDLSSGLDKIRINRLDNFAWNNQMLWAAGIFENIAGTLTSSVMHYHPERGWLLGDSSLNGVQLFLGQYKDRSIINGEFETVYGQNYQHVAEISAFHALLAGRFFDDQNANCLEDAGESEQGKVTFIIKPGDHYFTADANGYFSIPVMPGNYTITPIPDKNREFKCNPAAINVTGFKTINDILIGVRNIASRTDAAVRLYDYSGWKVTTGEIHHYKLCAKNVGTVTLESGKLIFYLPSELELFSFNPVPDFLDLSRAEWNLSKINVNGEYCVDIYASFKSGADKLKPIKINSKVEINGNSDLDPGDNQELLEQNWVSSINYNSKSTSLSGNYVSDAEPLHYRISFQNQTNGVANRVRITDTLDKNISIGAKGIIENTSHPSDLSYSYHLLPDGKYQYVLNWDFKNIELPDSSADALGSLGFIDLKIHTDMRFMKRGSEICNRAYLYFNNNEPFTTNVVCNSIGNVGKVNEIRPRLSMYPNPASQTLQVEVPNAETEYTLINLLGASVLKGQLNVGLNQLNLSNLQPGIYLFKADGFEAERLIIQPSR